MTPIYLTLNSTTEKQEIANFVYAILAQFKKNPHVLQEVYINDQAWVARDFFGGDLYLTRGTIQSYEENKIRYDELIQEDQSFPKYHSFFQHLRVNGDVGETVSPLIEGYTHNPAVMAPEILIDAIARMSKH